MKPNLSIDTQASHSVAPGDLCADRTQNAAFKVWPPRMRRLGRVATQVACCAVIALVSSGCAVTRIGALVPGHTRSQQIKGELVTAHYIQIEANKSGSGVEALPGVATGVSALAGVALDALKQELIREAKSYEHQSSTRLLLTTNNLGNGGIIVVTRWIQGKPVPGEPAIAELIEDLEDQTVKVVGREGGSGGFGERQGAIENTLAKLLTRDGKRVAEVLTLRVKREPGSDVYRIGGAKLWVGAVGAKVVNFGWGNLPKVWEWPGALLLKSDSQAEIEAAVNIKSLVNVEKSELKWSEVKPESGVLSSTKVNLNELPKTYNLGSNVGAWLAVPRVKFEGGATVGFVVMDFKLNERDTSNAQKYIEQAADAVDKNRDSILGALGKVIK